MPDLSIDRLTLHLSDLSAADGRRLAELVATGLASTSFMGDGTASLTITVEQRPGEGLDRLSARIVAAVAGQLEVH